MKIHRGIPMSSFSKVAIVAAGLLALAGCSKTAVDMGAEEAAIRAITPAWYKAYNAGDADGVAALYSEGAVLNMPGAPAVQSRAAIREALAKDIATSAKAGLSLNQGPSPEFGVTNDIAWEWNTFTVSDKSGATVDTGKYVTVFWKKDGKWAIKIDIWNSDAPAATPAPVLPAPAAAAPT
jgi:uncharacterized protein (TIGR02246 family)